MGQMTFGLFYGVQAAAVPLRVNLEWLLDDYRAAKSDAILSLAESEGCDLWTASRRLVPDWETGSDPAFLGFFVAAGASGKEGVPQLKPFRLSSIDENEEYTQAMHSAKSAWSLFLQWCVSRGIMLPEPELWLTETEVA